MENVYPGYGFIFGRMKKHTPASQGELEGQKCVVSHFKSILVLVKENHV
jgi:hypothetical protein